MSTQNKLPKDKQEAIDLLKKHDVWIPNKDGQPKYFALTNEQAKAIAAIIEKNDIGKVTPPASDYSDQ